MAIVEDEVRNESEEENEIEVVVEEDDAEQDTDDSDDEEDEGVLERKVAELEKRISEDPYNYDEHIELIQALWTLTELERWRTAFERLQQMTALRAEHWLLWVQTEASLAHSWESRERIAELFKQAALDCYSIPILTEWCSWAISTGDVKETRAQLDEVLHRAGADPFSGKLFWDAKLEFEKAQLEAMSNDAEEEYKAQQKRVLFCLEEAVSRPVLRGDEAWQPLHELAAAVHDDSYVHKIKKQHEAAVEYLNKITPYEDKLLTTENPEDKCRIYEEYIDLVKELSQHDEYAECDSNGILKVLYERVTTECMNCERAYSFLVEYARLTQRVSSRATYARVLDAGVRRCPRRHVFWTMKMQQAEHEGKDYDEVKSIFEIALSKGIETYKHAEALWLSWLEFIRRRTAFDNESEVQRLRSTFRLAWDSLAEAWGEEANDCEVPLYWARLEYKRMGDHKQGKEIFEEIFRYGENKTMSKYWEALIQLESNRSPPAGEHKLRDLHRRALKFVTDYPPAAARLWTDFERDVGELHTLRECVDLCEVKLKEWRDSYQAMKEKMTGKKQKQKPKVADKKTKLDKNKRDEKPKNKGKRKAEDGEGSSDGKKKREDMEVEVEMKQDGDSGGVKRSHEDDDEEDESQPKRQRTASEENARIGREACTLFVSNLEFKVNEQNLRDKLSQYGDIVSMRVKAGVKAFGGSICYCQYKKPESVDKALKDDRTPLDGRPMFFSRYSMNKGKPTFKYATTAEKNKLFVKNLPYSCCTKTALGEVFDKYGKLSDVRVVTFKDGKPKGLAYIEYEDEASAAAALAATNGLELDSRKIDVAFSAPPPRPQTSLGLPKRDAGGGMRRTQLSSFIPSVLQKPSTSKANGDHANETSNGEKRPLSNSDFRSFLLKK